MAPLINLITAEWGRRGSQPARGCRIGWLGAHGVVWLCEILEAQDCIDPTASLDLQWKVSLFLHSTYHYWSLKMQAIHIGSYPDLRAVYLMSMINIGPWEMCILSTLIFEILQSSTEPCPSLCMIIHYGGGPWPPSKINQSPVCHCAKTWWISYPLWVSSR